MTDTIGRNDPCHCGSGSKYKNCCIKKDDSSTNSNIGVGILIAVIVLGLLFLGKAFLFDEGGIDCPTGKVWSQEHQHCH